MRTDVRTLIAALTTERTSLDRAIYALQQISGAQTEPPKTLAAAVVTRTRRMSAATRARMSENMKAKHAAKKASDQPWSAYHTPKDIKAVGTNGVGETVELVGVTQ